MSNMSNKSIKTSRESLEEDILGVKKDILMVENTI